MLNRLRFAFNYLYYFFSAANQHSVHSPFVYKLITDVINLRKNKPFYHNIELIRTKMLKSKAMVKVLPIGAGKGKPEMQLKDLVKRSASSARYGELLERICVYFNPEFALEIGSSVGMSTMYQAAGIVNGHLIALEGNPDSVRIARHNLESIGMQNVQIIEGLFDDTLPMVLQQIPRLDYVFFDGNHRMEATLHYFELCFQKAHTSSVFIFDDIRWSDEMESAWSKIKNHPAVTVTVDLYAMGIVFFRKEQEKEHFTIRF